MTTGDILDVIDNALEDYEVSADAMRWKPESVSVRVDADVQAFLEAIDRDVHDLAVISFRRYPEPGQEWWEWWEDAPTQTERR